MLASALAALSTTAASLYTVQDGFDERNITKREVQYGGMCGDQGNGASCAAGLCCTHEGHCGNGTVACAAPDCQFNFAAACDTNQSPFNGADTSLLPRPLFGDIKYGEDIYHCNLPGKIAFTFDDGPTKYTNDLLDILKRNNVNATFFVTGNNRGKGHIEDTTTGFPKILQRMVNEGHQIGSHTWSHENLQNITPGQRQDQIIKNEIALVDILGYFPTYLRTPFSAFNAEVKADLRRYGYHIMQFDLDTDDDIIADTQQELRDKFSSKLSGKSPADGSFIVVAHDLIESTVHGLVQYMIDEARKHKFEPVTLGDCLGDPRNNWYRDAKTGAEFGGQAPKRPQIPAGDSSSTSSLPSNNPPSASSASGTVPSTGPGNTPKPSGDSSSSSSSAAATGMPKPSNARRNISSSFGNAFPWLIILALFL